MGKNIDLSKKIQLNLNTIYKLRIVQLIIKIVNVSNALFTYKFHEFCIK